MSKISDRDRILRHLLETEGLSNSRIKIDLNLSDERYAKVREDLIDEGLVERMRCQGGGLRLTSKGESTVPISDDFSSKVVKEADLYGPLVEFLIGEADDEGISAVVCPTHRLKARGQWQNPDVTRIAIENYPNLRKVKINVTTFEVKQFPKWDVSVVYEAASHHRFSHDSYVVLEWPNEAEFSPTDTYYKLDQIYRECRRFGIGLSTLHSHYNSYRLRSRIEARPQAPDDENVEAWLEYVFSRDKGLARSFSQLMDKAKILRDDLELTKTQVESAVSYANGHSNLGRPHATGTVKSALRKGRGGLSRAFAAARHDHGA